MHVEHTLVTVSYVISDPLNGRLDLVGELDLTGSQRLRDAGAAVLAAGAAEVVVDLAQLRFIDASGIGLLVELGNALAAREALLRIVKRDDRIGRVFSLCGLNTMLAVPGAS